MRYRYHGLDLPRETHVGDTYIDTEEDDFDREQHSSHYWLYYRRSNSNALSGWSDATRDKNGYKLGGFPYYLRYTNYFARIQMKSHKFKQYTQR